MLVFETDTNICSGCLLHSGAALGPDAAPTKAPIPHTRLGYLGEYINYDSRATQSYKKAEVTGALIIQTCKITQCRASSIPTEGC